MVILRSMSVKSSRLHFNELILTCNAMKIIFMAVELGVR